MFERIPANRSLAVAARPRAPIGNEAFAGLCRARELLSEIDAPRLSIDDIARHACMSPFHFIRRFEALFGTSPHQYRIRSRLDRARLLLAKGQLSVTEICFEVGFASLGSFSDLFKRRTGLAPSEYQRRARVMVSVPGVIPQELFPGCLSLMGRLPRSAFSQFSRSAPAANFARLSISGGVNRCESS